MWNLEASFRNEMSMKDRAWKSTRWWSWFKDLAVGQQEAEEAEKWQMAIREGHGQSCPFWSTLILFKTLNI